MFQYGANVEAVDSNQQTPLHKAAANNQAEAIEVLLEHKAKIEKRDEYVVGTRALIAVFCLAYLAVCCLNYIS